MEKELSQRFEWFAAQDAVISVDLVKAAKQQLRFLAAVDDMHCLYVGHALDRAIYRYNYCWFPLLAKHAESPTMPEPLVVPLDCEWIWHCHRLNPYKIDCEEAYGRILDNINVLSTVEGACTKATESIWNRLYPTEPYYFEQSCSLATGKEISGSFRYDLAAAVKRQSSFFQKVSISITDDDAFLIEAVARYKAFIHMIKRSDEKSIKLPAVPTLDIDLIWHSHQQYPVSYNNDMKAILAKVMDHNDRDFDGAKLKIGFARTAKFWEDIYGMPYLKATKVHEGGDCCKCFSCGVRLINCVSYCTGGTCGHGVTLCAADRSVGDTVCDIA